MKELPYTVSGVGAGSAMLIKRGRIYSHLQPRSAAGPQSLEPSTSERPWS